MGLREYRQRAFTRRLWRNGSGRFTKPGVWGGWFPAAVVVALVILAVLAYAFDIRP